jgi:hypothetical protein
MRWRHHWPEVRVICLTGLLVLASSAIGQTDSNAPAWHEKLGLTGTLRLDYYQSSKSFDDTAGHPGVAAEVVARPSLDARFDGRFSARVGAPSIGRGGGTNGRVLEAYGTWHAESIDLRIGKQIVAWGRADGINPTDNITPRDLAIMLPFEEDQRLGVAAAKLDWIVRPEHTLTVFATPYFEPSVIPWPNSGPEKIETRPTRNIANTQVGLRWNKVGEGFDWSISYFRGFSHLPSLVPTRTPTTVEARYDRVQVLGADFARNFGRFGVRGEMAYSHTDDRLGRDPFVRNPQVYGVLGVDRTFFDNLNVNVQVFARHVYNHSDPRNLADPVARSWAVQSALLAGQLDHVGSGVTFRVSNKWLNDTLEVEVFGIVNARSRDGFLRPLITYSFSDRWKGTLAAELYRGRPGTQFGGQRANRGWLAELRLGF